jgi:hypothetical protein
VHNKSEKRENQFRLIGPENSVLDFAVAVLCEYDALPKIGHACGHNLIAEAGLACFVAACEALQVSHGNGKVCKENIYLPLIMIEIPDYLHQQQSNLFFDFHTFSALHFLSFRFF